MGIPYKLALIIILWDTSIINTERSHKNAERTSPVGYITHTEIFKDLRIMKLHSMYLKNVCSEFRQNKTGD